MKLLNTLSAACIAATAMADESKCCQLYKRSNMQGNFLEFCIQDGEAQSTYDIDFRGLNRIRSAKCGAHVEAQVCPGGYHEAPVEGQREKKITCKTIMKNPYEAEEVLSIHGEEYHRTLAGLEMSTIIINNHPWVAKGPDYVSMGRNEKTGIIWDKITENDQIAPAAGATDYFAIDPNTDYDEWGDEFDCRTNVFNSQGNVGKVRWEDLGGHPYTGIFAGGADSGFIRLSTETPVNADVSSSQTKMNPTLALKLLRNQRDSANTVANLNFFGQDSYNFFEHDLTTAQLDGVTPNTETEQVMRKYKAATDYQGSVGHSDFAMYNQDGHLVDEPQFPFRLQFRPSTSINFPARTYDTSIFEQMKAIQPNQVLYEVHAQEEFGSAEQHIANIVLESQLVTSLWADQHMYFRRQRFDDDIRYHAEWSDHVFKYLDAFDQGVPTLRPKYEKKHSSCFNFMFQD